MTFSRPRIDGVKQLPPGKSAKVLGPAFPVPVIPPKPAGVRKPIPRTKTTAYMTAALSTTRDHGWQAAVALKNEELEQSDEYLSPIRPRASRAKTMVSSLSESEESEDLSPIRRRVTKAKIIITCPFKAEVSDDSDVPLQRRANGPKTIGSSSPLIKPSALPAPSAPANTETELENLMTTGREKVEKELRDRIEEEKEKNCLLDKQMITFKNYQKYLMSLKELEDELIGWKEESRLNEDTVADLAEDFRESTMEWAALFEKYAGEFGI